MGKPIQKKIQTQPPSWGHILGAVLFLLAVTLGVYANSMDGHFLWDDETLVQNNPLVRQAALSSQIFTTTLFDGAGNFTNFYRPLQTLTYVVDRMLWNFNVFGYHLTNVLFHWLMALSLLWLSWVLFGDFLLSFLASLLFVVHPVHTEAVSYIAGRADPMAAALMVFAFVFYIRQRILGLCAFFVASLLSRENALMLLPFIIFYHYAWKKPLWRKGLWALLAVSAVYLAGRHMLLSSIEIRSIDSNVPSTWERLPSFFISFPAYLRLLPLPLWLHMEYGSILYPWSDPGVVIGIVVFVLYITALIRARRKDEFVFWCLGFFLLGLLPVCHLFLINASMAEHWLYLPSLGFFWLTAAFLSRGMRSQRWKIGALCLAAALTAYFSYLTIQQNELWRDPVKQYKNILRYSPNSAKTYNNLAKAYHDQGKKDELIDLLKTSIAVDRRNFAALNNLGNALREAGRYEEAEEAYRKAIELEPTGAHQYLNLSLIYSEVRKDNKKAEELLRTAISYNPRCAEAYHQLALLAMRAEDWERAKSYLAKELEIYPDQAPAYKALGYIYYKNKQWPQAEEAFEKALQLKPNYAEAYHDLAVIYASQGKNQQAWLVAKKAESLGFNDAEFIKSLE